VLVHTSRMEGGAHVVIEALRSGTPVLASRIAGNLGLLGRRLRRPASTWVTTRRWQP
jgi:glycosyltransferase involved in cell wall biosynthesis